MPEFIAPACTLMFLALMVYVCFDDARRYIIPNEISLLLIVLLPLASWSGAVPVPWWSSLGAMAILGIYTGLPWYMAQIDPEHRRVFPGWIAIGSILLTMAAGAALTGSVSAVCRPGLCGDDRGMLSYLSPQTALVILIVCAVLCFLSLVLWLSSTGKLVYGGGDFKFSTAVAGWIGLGGVGNFIVVTALAGGALAVVYLGLRRLDGGSSIRRWFPAIFLHGNIPYGIAIAIGATAAYFRMGPL